MKKEGPIAIDKCANKYKEWVCQEIGVFSP